MHPSREGKNREWREKGSQPGTEQPGGGACARAVRGLGGPEMSSGLLRLSCWGMCGTLASRQTPRQPGRHKRASVCQEKTQKHFRSLFQMLLLNNLCSPQWRASGLLESSCCYNTWLAALRTTDRHNLEHPGSSKNLGDSLTVRNPLGAHVWDREHAILWETWLHLHHTWEQQYRGWSPSLRQVPVTCTTSSFGGKTFPGLLCPGSARPVQTSF